MDTIIAILLYMQLLQSPGTYQQSQIDQLQAQYQHEINVIQNDPVQMQEVNQVYLPKVQDVIVIGWPDDARIETENNFCLTKSQYKLQYYILN